MTTPAKRAATTEAEVVEQAVLAVAGVVRLDAGEFGGFGTYLPGRVVPGVRVGRPPGLPEARVEVEVHVCVTPDSPLPEVAQRVREAVRAALPGAAVTVVVADIEPAGAPS